MVRLVVASRNLRLYHSALKYFKSITRIKGVWPGEPISPEVRVVLTTLEEEADIKKFYGDKTIAVSNPDLSQMDDEFFIQIMLKLRQVRKEIERLLIGIDPGKITGISLQADGMLLVAEEIEITKVPGRIFSLVGSFPAEKTFIKIGDNPNYGQPLILKLINKMLDFSEQEGISLYLINEASTTKNEWKISNDHRTAALKIALREGKKVTSIAEAQENLPKISKGRLREIQNWSRQMSKSITISAYLASCVAKGEMTLNKAIKLQKERDAEK